MKKAMVLVSMWLHLDFGDDYSNENDEDSDKMVIELMASQLLFTDKTQPEQRCRKKRIGTEKKKKR